MNQILVTKKLYVTPELKRKKKLYKIQLFLSVFLVCLLSSYYIYAEYDRTKSEEVSQEILAGLKFSETEVESKSNDTTTIKRTDNVVIVAIEPTQEEDNQIEEQVAQTESQPATMQYTTSAGVNYTVDAFLNIPSLGINYAVLSETSEELLKISINKFWGPKPNEVGNYCIVGHNYKNKKMFGKLSEIVNGAIIELQDSTGRTLKYSVYDKYVVDPDDVKCTSQLTNGKREVTLITCTNYGKERLVVKAVEVK